MHGDGNWFITTTECTKSWGYGPHTEMWIGSEVSLYPQLELDKLMG